MLDRIYLGRPLQQVTVIGNQPGKVVLHIVDAHPERMVTDKKGPGDACRVGEIHRQFRPEITIEQVAGAMVQGAVERMQVDVVEQVAQLGLLGDARQHLLRGHHQLQQCREGGDAPLYEVQITGNVVQAKANVFFVGAVAGQLVHAVAEPMIMLAPMFFLDKVVEGFFDYRQPAFVAGQPIEAHQAESGFAVVINDAKRRFDAQVLGVQYMHKSPAFSVLHPGYAVGERFEQRQVVARAGDLAVLDQCQQAHRIAAQFDLIAGVGEEGRHAATRQQVGLDQHVSEVLQRALDSLFQVLITGQRPGLDH